MELIDRYIAEIGRQLPEKTRPDIEREIRSLIEDMLEDRAQKAGRPIDEEMVVAVLKEYGAPGKVAASYFPDRYLIGPRIFPSFLMVSRIVLPIIIILSIVGVGVDLGRNELTRDIPTILAEGFAGIISSLIQALGMIVLIFAILERTVPEFRMNKFGTDEKDWDPRKLPKPSPAPDKVKLGSLSVEIAFTMLGLVLFNFYPNKIAVFPSLPGDPASLPILAEIFFTRYLPWITVIWVLQIILDIILISRGRWEVFTTWTYMGVKAAMIILGMVMITGPSLVGLTSQDLVSAGTMDPQSADLIITVLGQAVRWAIVIAVIASGVDIVQTVWRQFLRKPVEAVVVG